MEIFGMIGFMFGIIGMTSAESLKKRVAKLERIVNDSKLDEDTSSLTERLQKSIGKICVFKFYDSVSDLSIYDEKLLILDVDNDWVLVKTSKKEVEKLISLKVISTIDFVD